MRRDNNAQNGFTLVEISMALIIIALVIGGIFVGQTLIKSSQLNKMMADVNNYKAAINSFRLKYDCLPGDCANATNFFAGTTNGDGDGYIADNEEFFAWEHLGLADLITGKYIGTDIPPEYWSLGHSYQAGYNVPHTSINDTSFFRIFYEGNVTDGYNHKFYVRYLGYTIRSADICKPSYAECEDAVLTTKEVYYIDSKYDDGNAWFGNIVSESSDICADDPAYSSDGSYHVSSTTEKCIPVFLLGF